MRLGQRVIIHKPADDPTWVRGMDKYDGKTGIVIRRKNWRASAYYEVSRFTGLLGKPFFFLDEWMEAIND